MKKRILFLSPLPPPDYGSALSSKMCLEILEDSKNFQVKNIKLNYSKIISDIGKINFSKVKGFFNVGKEIKEEIKKFKPKTIYFVPATHGFGLIRDYFFIRQIKKFWKGKILFHIRSRTIRNKFNDWFYKKIFNNQRAIVLGKILIKDISKWIKKQDIFILPNAIENQISDREFDKITQNRKRNRKLNLLFLSNMDKEKGWTKVLDACKILQEKNFNFECNFVGEWVSQKDREIFEKFVSEHNLVRKVKYLGKMIGEDKKNFFLNSNLFVFPTEYKLEACPRVILEAMMFGLPVIANSIGAIPSLVTEGKTGFLLKGNSPEEVAEKITKLKNKNLRENMSRTSRKKFLDNYNLKNYKEKFKKIFSQISN